MRLKNKVAIITGGGPGACAYATALRREGGADEVADAVVYLASEESSFLTGVNLDINGGLYYS